MRAQATLTATLVGLVRMSNMAERFCDWATSARMSSSLASASISNITRMAEKPLRISGIHAEDAAHVDVALDRRADRAELDAAMLRHGGDAAGQAAGERGQHDLGRRRGAVMGGEDLRVIGFDREGLLAGVLLRRGRSNR